MTLEFAISIICEIFQQAGKNPCLMIALNMLVSTTKVTLTELKTDMKDKIKLKKSPGYDLISPAMLHFGKSGGTKSFL